MYVEEPSPHLVRHGQKRLEARHAGIGDKNVDSVELADGKVDQTLCEVLVRNIAEAHGGNAPGVLNLTELLRGALLVGAVDDDVGPFGGEGPGDGPSDASGRTRHNGSLTAEYSGHIAIPSIAGDGNRCKDSA